MQIDNRRLLIAIAVSLVAHAALLLSLGAPAASGSGSAGAGMRVALGPAVDKTSPTEAPTTDADKLLRDEAVENAPKPVKDETPDLKPVEIMKPEPKPVEIKKPEPTKPQPKPIEIKKPEPKPVEIKKPEPKKPQPKPIEMKRPEPKKPETKPVRVKKAAPPKKVAKPRPKKAAPKRAARKAPPAAKTRQAAKPAGTERKSKQTAALRPGDDGRAETGSGRGDAMLPVMRSPRFGRAPRPAAYPRLSVQREEEGTVIIRALVHRRGNPDRVRVWRSSGYPRLDQAALKAVRRWVFLPMQRGGRAVAAWVEIPVRFRLQ